MSDYTEITVQCTDEASEILIAELYSIGYEGFWETDDGFKAYILKNHFEHHALQNLIKRHIPRGENITFTLANIPDQNWNEEWEKNFEPVILSGKYLIKAPFHFIDAPHLVSFTISPKMAFGTGHHSTTQLMIEMMLRTPMVDKKVLDLGTGTGILSIFAEHLGAAKIVAIDNSPEAIDCAKENFDINNCKKCKAYICEIDQLQEGTFDVIAANINRNTLTEQASYISEMLNNNDILLVSGFYEVDVQHVSSIFEKVNLIFETSISKNTWVACQFIKA